MKLSYLILICAVAAGSGCAHAKQEAAPAKVEAKDAETSAGLSLTSNGTKALARLKDATMFADPYVGIAGSPSPEVAAFVTVLNDPGAARAFRDLYANAKSMEGKLYGLCGLWYVDDAAFKRGVEELRGSTAQVQTMSGCIVGRKALGGMIRVAGKYPPRVELDGPKDSIDAWVKRQSKPPENYVLDFEGGGIPFMMGEQRNNPRFAWK